MEMVRNIVQKDFFPVMLADIFAALLDITAACAALFLRRHPFAKIPDRLVAACDEGRYIHARIAFLQIVIAEFIRFPRGYPSIDGGPGGQRHGNGDQLSPLHDPVLRHLPKLLVEPHIQVQRFLCAAFPDIIQ